MPPSGRTPRLRLRVRAAVHELSCAECRVTWSGWAGRLLGVHA
jgi:hypothetical protein